jgi:FkbM family methyltransferase
LRTLKPQLQKTLKRLGLYHRLQASSLYDFYWTLADRSLVARRGKEIEFYRQLLSGFRQGDLIFDVGANHGAKTDVFLRLGAQVVAIEPDNVNQQILKEKFLRYRLTRKPVVIVGKALSDKKKVERMWVDEPGSAKNTLSRKWVETLRGDEERFGHRLNFGQWTEVETTTLEQLITEQGLPFFIKIDVEGHELSVLQGLHRPVPYLSFEVNLPEFKSEGLACIERLAGLACDGKFNYASDCQQGFLLDRWLEPQEFSRKLEQCTEKSVEVFWKTSASTRVNLPRKG